jgi:hypothetical protein
MEADNRKAVYVISGEEVFLIIIDAGTDKEVSRALIPTITFEQAAQFGIADHRLPKKEE